MKATTHSPTQLTISAQVRELREADAKDRRERQIAAIAKLVYRAADESRRRQGRK